MKRFTLVCWIAFVIEVVMIGTIGYAYFYGESRLCGEVCLEEFYYGK